MKRFIVLVLLVSFGLLSQQARASDSDDILVVAHQFLLDANMGDLDKLADISRPGDAALVPKPRSEEAAEMMKMKDRPELQKIRQELAAEIPKAFALGQPVISADGKSATVAIQPAQAEGRKYYELKAVYNAFMGDAYVLTKQGKSMPTLEEVQGRVLAADSPQQKWIDQKAANFANEAPALNFEKTAAGWKLNLQALFGKPS
jgi:hypothetical protein